MQVENLIESFSEFKEVKNINRETMMNKGISMLLLMLIKVI